MNGDKSEIVARSVQEFSDSLAIHGVKKARALLKDETGHEPARSTLYDVAAGKGKEGNIILLNYALQNALKKEKDSEPKKNA